MNVMNRICRVMMSLFCFVLLLSGCGNAEITSTEDNKEDVIVYTSESIFLEEVAESVLSPLCLTPEALYYVKNIGDRDMLYSKNIAVSGSSKKVLGLDRGEHFEKFFCVDKQGYVAIVKAVQEGEDGRLS